MEETYRSPWFNMHGYLACTVKYTDGSRRTVLKHREVIEQQRGRCLYPSELVHHKDGDKRNNDLENLEVTSRSAHSSMHCDRDIEYVNLTCLMCNFEFQKEAKEERARIKKGRNGPFCGKSCAGRFQRERQIANGQSNLRVARVAQ